MTAPPCAAGCKRPSPSAVICAECTAELARALVTAASIAGDLDDAAARLMTRGGGGRASSEVPLPFDPGASAAAAALNAELALWACRVTRYANAALDTAGAARHLLERLDALRQHPQAGEAHRGILAAVRRAEAVVDRKPERVGCGRCDRCGAQSWAEGDEDTAVCERGHIVLNARQRRLNKAREVDPLATPAEISAFLGRHGYTVKESTISGWGTTGRIVRHPGGFYRLSEALDMAARMGTRRPRVGG